MRLERNARENQIKKEKMKAEAKERDIKDMEYKEKKAQWTNALDEYNDYDKMKTNTDPDYNVEEDFL